MNACVLLNRSQLLRVANVLERAIPPEGRHRRDWEIIDELYEAIYRLDKRKGRG